MGLVGGVGFVAFGPLDVLLDTASVFAMILILFFVVVSGVGVLLDLVAAFQYLTMTLIDCLWLFILRPIIPIDYLFGKDHPAFGNDWLLVHHLLTDNLLIWIRQRKRCLATCPY